MLIMQAVQNLLQEKLGQPVYTADYALDGHTLSQSAIDVYDRGTTLYGFIGPKSTLQWDFVILQVSRVQSNRTEAVKKQGMSSLGSKGAGTLNTAVKISLLPRWLSQAWLSMSGSVIS